MPPKPCLPAPWPGTSCTTNEADQQDEHHRANRGVDDRSCEARAKLQTDLRQQPPADIGSEDPDDDVTDDTEPGALYDVAG